MGQHDPLGLACGAGSIDEGGKVFRKDVVGAAVKGGIAGPCFLSTSRTSDERQHGICGSLFIHEDDAFDRGLRARLHNFFILAASGDDGNACGRVGQENRCLVGGQRRVDGDVDGSEGECCEIGNGPLPAIFAEDGDALPLGDAQAVKASATARTRW